MSRVALVTGAARGLGKAFTRRLLKKGACVAIVDIDAKEGHSTCKEFQDAHGKDKVVFSSGNVTNQRDMERVFEFARSKFGGLDIVVNNAGLQGEFIDSWENTIDVNVRGTIRCTLLAMDYLRRDRGGKGGVIINVASWTGIKPSPCAPTYSASKSALIAFSLSWAKNPEILNNGVRINVFAPEFVESPRLSEIQKEGNVFLPDIFNTLKENAGVLSEEAMSDAFMELVDPEFNKHGQVLKLNKNDGKTYIPVAD